MSKKRLIRATVDIRLNQGGWYFIIVWPCKSHSAFDGDGNEVVSVNYTRQGSAERAAKCLADKLNLRLVWK